MKTQRGLAILEVILAVTLISVVIFAVYLTTQKKKSPSSPTANTKVSTTAKPQDAGIKSVKDVDTAIKENDAESTAQIDSDLNEIDHALKDL